MRCLVFGFLDPTFLDVQVPGSPNSQISRFPDFQTPPAAAPPLDELSDPKLTPLPTHPWIKYVAPEVGSRFVRRLQNLCGNSSDGYTSLEGPIGVGRDAEPYTITYFSLTMSAFCAHKPFWTDWTNFEPICMVLRPRSLFLKIRLAA